MFLICAYLAVSCLSCCWKHPGQWFMSVYAEHSWPLGSWPSSLLHMGQAACPQCSMMRCAWYLIKPLYHMHTCACVRACAVHTLRENSRKLTHFVAHCVTKSCVNLSGTWWTRMQKSLQDEVRQLLLIHTSTHLTAEFSAKNQQTTEMGNLISRSASLNSIIPYLPRCVGSCGCSDCMCS